ncbi:uncharacterized protein LOC127288379 isoform X2 [Leptopilina boulardi]|uniref:uncharacterized protein LOC127288379 isoform X2 n=1 Tax=Leptopilina boulardi TaxID=63433 RepID=UPI0021F50F0B|nr:uncharacterized protein LOC127288379 isoform X2 [Leptopilina boulardi]
MMFKTIFLLFAYVSITVGVGTKAVYRVPDPYTYPTENRECGRVDGRVSIFKRNLQKPRLNPLVLGIHFLGNVTGAECSN